MKIVLQMAMLALGLLNASVLEASPDEYAALDTKTANQVFWSFTKCVARRDPEATELLLRSIHWSKSEEEDAAKLAARNNTCALAGGDKLTMDEALFRSSLATAVFISHHKNSPLPDYATLAFQFDGGRIASAATSEQKARILLLHFAECVFRARPEQVRKLLELPPMSDAENRAWEPLDPVLGSCLPATAGTQMRFSRMSLRGLLGEAAYELDRARTTAGAAH